MTHKLELLQMKEIWAKKTDTLNLRKEWYAWMVVSDQNVTPRSWQFFVKKIVWAFFNQFAMTIFVL